MRTWPRIALYCFIALLLGYLVRDRTADPVFSIEAQYVTYAPPQETIEIDGNTLHGNAQAEANQQVIFGDGSLKPHPVRADYIYHPRSTCGVSIQHHGLVYRVVSPSGEPRQFATQPEAEAQRKVWCGNE